MKKTLGSYLIELLEAQGVQHVFGIPGVHNLELYRGLASSRIHHVTGRHEQGLGFMADGYARVSGRPGVCFTITGPGLTNIATALGQAYADSIPLFVIASENRTTEIGTGRGFLHEMPEQLGLAAKVTARSQRLERPEDLPEAITQAFAHLRSDRPRPSYLEIPRDLMTADASAWPAPQPTAPAQRPSASAASLAEAARALRTAKSPLILAGGGALGAVAELRKLAEHIGAPVVMTINARGLLPPEHPLGVPMSPSLQAVRSLIQDADVCFAVGTELGPTDYDMYAVAEFHQPRYLIRLDIDAEQLRRNAQAQLALHSDAALALKSLLALDLGPARTQSGQARARDACNRALAELSPVMRGQINFLDTIRDELPQAVLVGDSTQAVYAGNLGFAAATPASWFNSATGYGTLGYALPAATGAWLAAPDRPVVCLVGDGGIQFSLGEMAVPRDVGAWLAIVIWNNHGYGEIKTSMLAVDIDPVGVDVRPPDFRQIAAAYGYPYEMIDSIEALQRALKQFAARRQVVVLEVRGEKFE